MEKIVWVVNYKHQDIDSAAKFGELRKLTEGNINVFALDLLLKRFADSLKDSCNEDYLLPCGSIIINMIASVVMLEKHGVLNLLIFDLRTKEYVRRSFGREVLKKYVNG